MLWIWRIFYASKIFSNEASVEKTGNLQFLNVLLLDRSLVDDPMIVQKCSLKNKEIIAKDAYRSGSHFFRNREDLKLFQFNLEYLLLAFFALNDPLEYYQGFNDIISVVYLAFQDNAETLYYVQQLADRHFNGLLKAQSFSSEMLGNLFLIENVIRQELELKEDAESVRVLLYSQLISKSKQLVPNLVFTRLA
jgi:hypothetical protein